MGSNYPDFLHNDDYGADENDWVPVGRDGVIFLIDCSSSMVSEKIPDDLIRDGADTGLKLAILCCQNFMQNKALNSSGDMVGLVFMRANLAEFNGVHIVQLFRLKNLDFVDARRILEIEKIRGMPPDEFIKFYANLPLRSSYPIHEALWTCQNMFNMVKKSLVYKRIFLMTNDPDPVGNQVQFKRQALLKAIDLRQSGVELEVVPIPREGTHFNISAFCEYLLPYNAEVDPLYLKPFTHFDHLLTWEKLREPRRRRVAFLPIYLIPATPTVLAKGTTAALAFGVAAYCLVRRVSPPKQVRLYAKTNESVTIKHRFFKAQKLCQQSEDIGSPVMPQNVVNGLHIGSRTVCFDSNEISGRPRQVVAAGIHILGFKQLKQLKPWCQMRTPRFLYPEEGLAKGSTLWFTMLLASCLRKEVFALALYVQRPWMRPHLVALVPQAEEHDENGSQVSSQGFHILFFPFREDFRQLNLHNSSLGKSEKVKVARQMINKMSAKYYPDAIPNPTLQRQYAELEALALDRNEAQQIVDYLKPDLQQIKEHAGDEIKRFADLIAQASVKPEPSPTISSVKEPQS